MNSRVQDILKKLPAKPGVYIHKDKDGKILYIGKAKRLRSRVRQYFQKRGNVPPDKQMMIDQIADIDYTVVDSELEALLLETTLIKKHKPPFNIRMTDDKNWQYIKIPVRDEEFPNIYPVRAVKDDGAHYYGPYTNSAALKSTLRLLRRIFLFRDCKLDITEEKIKAGTQKTFIKNNRPCLDYHIKKCVAPCAGKVTRDEYAVLIEQVEQFLQGKHGEVLKMLEEQMAQASKDRRFEIAARNRDQITAIKRMAERQKVISTTLTHRDIVSFVTAGRRVFVNLFIVREGKLLEKKNFVLRGDSVTDSVTASFVQDYYQKAVDFPDEVLVQEELEAEEVAALEELLNTRKEALSVRRNRKKVRIVFPKIGSARKLVDIGTQNAEEYMRKQTEADKRERERSVVAIEKLGKALGLSEPPKRIECYDISNNQGVNPVGSMVVFENGSPKKSDYRKFAIKTVEGPNDFAMMREVLQRRVSAWAKAEQRAAEGKDDEKKDESFSTKPDLIIIDGGKGQLSAVTRLLDEMGVNDLTVVSLAKREEEVFVPGRPKSIMLPRGSNELYLVQRIRDEAHRFAISYYRKRHEKATTRSILEEIPGIGPVARKKLLKRFGSIDGVRRASDDELSSVVSRPQIDKLREYL